MSGEKTVGDMQPEIRIVDDAAALAVAAAEEFVDAAGEAVAARGRFTVALSGGSTPKQLYERLASLGPSDTTIPWPQTHLFWGDERLVPPDHADSNYRMARETLLDRVALPAHQIHRIPTDTGDATEAASRYEAELRAFFSPAAGEVPRFDLILLGLGGDGHTASLFPGSGAVREEIRWVVGDRVEGTPYDRVTLTFPVLNNAARVIFLVRGSDKAIALQSVLEGDAPIDRIPARGVRPRSGRLLWLVDRDGAASLT